MGSDACFRIGSNHTVCQDYAASGFDSYGHPYALVSDGCSGSLHTDFGSRFLVQAARLQLQTRYVLGDIKLDSLQWNGILATARGMAQSSHLPAQCLDATLIRAVQADNHIFVHHTGDGTVVARMRDSQKSEFVSMKFGENMPYYPSYRLNQDEEAKYLVKAKTYTQILGTEIAPASGSEVATWVTRETESPLNRNMLVGELVFGPEYDLVLIMTDGADSFQTANGDPVRLTAVLNELLALKSYEGEFVTRRCNRFLGKVCAERGWKHTDDISVAGIYRP